MTISERARARPPVAEMPERERPISEEFRLVAKAWVDANAAANLLEETKSAVLSKMMLALGEKSVAAAEMKVKASDKWYNHVKKIVDARAEADLRKVQMEYVRMKFSEWQSNDANSRREFRMGRQAP